MFYIKKMYAICLSIAMVMCSTLPSLASGNDSLQETTESKIVEQLKEDLGEEKANEIFNAYEETCNENVGDDILSTHDEEHEENEGASKKNVGASTASPEEETDEDVSSEPEENETRTGELYEPEETETSMNELSEPEEDEKSTEEISESEEGESSVSESYDFEENVEESTESLEEDETNVDESYDGNLDKNIATSSELDDEYEVIELDVEKENSEDSLLGASEPWMWWYITDDGHTIHYTSTEPTSAGIGISTNTSIRYESLTKKNITKAVFDNEIEFVTCDSLFAGFENLSLIENILNINTSKVTDMGSMFYDCYNLESIDVSGFDTSKVIDMSCMFGNFSKKGSDGLHHQNLLNINGINNFDTGNVVDMYGMFKNCEKLTTLDLSNFDTKNVTSMYDMFFECNSLSSLNLSSFNTSNVTNMSKMFASCKSLVSIDLSNFNTNNVTDMESMFSNCESIETLDLSSFETSKVNDMTTMFLSCDSLLSLNLSNFNTSNVTGMDSMFRYCEKLSSLDLSSFNTENSTSMYGMFSYCYKLESLDLSNFNTENVTNMEAMFYQCQKLESLDLSSFNTSNVANMSAMFYRCDSLVSISLSSFNTSNVTNMSRMFSSCEKLESLDLSNFNTSKVTNMTQMFDSCRSLTNLNLSTFNTSNVTNMLQMFEYCSVLTTLDLSSFNTSNVTNMADMFYQCTSLQSILVTSDFIVSNVTESNDMFLYCSALVGGNGTTYDSNHTDKEYARIDGGPTSATPGYFTLAGGGAPTLSSITVNTPPTKVKYKVGETFDPAGLKINLNYSDSSTDTVTYNSITSANFTFNPSLTTALTSSNTYVTITYSGKTCNQDVEVIAPQSITVKTAPSKLKYAIDETFNPTGLKINLVYSDTTTVEEVSYAGNESDFSFNPSGALNTAGASIPITITYTKNGNNFNCTQNVEVVELSSISINTQPTKTRYVKGTNFDPTGLKININYSDGTTELVTYNTTTSANFTFNGSQTLTLNTVGNPFEITIGYAGKTCIQNVIVAELDSIAITTHATKLNYNAGETFDPTGLVITLTYSDSSTEPVIYNSTTSSSFTFSPNGPLTRTGNVITVTYAGKTTTETLNVKELTGITIATNPTKLSYSTGQTLNPNGLVLTLTFTDSNNVNTTENVTYNSTTQSKFAFNPSGTAITTGNVTVTYDGKTGAGMQPTFAIIVRTVASISVINIPSKTSYSSGEKLAPSGLSIKVNYADGTNETIAYSSSNSGDFSFNPSTSTSLNTGHTNVTVTYGGKSTSFAISVTQSSGGYVPSSGGGNNSGGGGGGGGGGGIPAGTNPQNNSPTTTQVSSSKSISGIADSSTSTWATDPTTGKWKLNITLGNGQVAPATNGFFMLTNTVTQVVNNVPIQTQINNTYYFDAQGNMVTGWVQTADNKWFFFDNAKTADEGKMSLGWKQVQGSWYYFTPDGSMMENGITPDGFVIGADGKWVG